MAELLLAIDGGGSKTRVLTADLDGRVLGTGHASSSNYQSVGFEAATSALRHAIRQALDGAALVTGRASDRLVAAACFGLSGVDRPEDVATIGAWVAAEGIAQRFRVLNDAELLLAAGTPDGWGIALIAGTGSICYGRTPSGRVERAGGWGWLLGDEGSGYALGVDMLRLATQTADGRACAPEILEAVLSEWKLARADELVAHVYQRTVSRAEVAALASRLVDLSRSGSAEARAILERGGQELARHVAVVASKLDSERPPLVFGGGLLVSSPLMQGVVLSSAGVPLGPARSVEDPARGALVLARRLLSTK